MSKTSAYATGLTQITGAEDDVSGEPGRCKMDPTTKSLRVNLWVWDTNALGWVRMQEIDPLLDDIITELQNIVTELDGSKWKDQRYDYTSGNLDYKGVNETHKAATDSSTWEISKYTWTGSNITRIEGPLTGSWDGRAALAWA
jgi:hypothetical protein